MAHPTHPHLRELADRHKRRKKGGCHVYRAPNGVEAIVAGDTVHAARPGQHPRKAHRASLAHQSLGDLAHKLTSGSAAALPGHAYPIGARVQVFHVNRGEWGAPTEVTQHKAWRGSPGYHVADRVVWVPESHVRRAGGATRGTPTGRRRRAPQTTAPEVAARGRGGSKSKTRIVLISCSRRQMKVPRAGRVLAKDLYTAPLFRNCVALARTMVSGDSQIRILSGTHGLLKLTEKVPGKDFTLHDIGKAKQRAWGVKVVEQLRRAFGAGRRECVFLAGELYTDAVTQAPKSLSAWRFEDPLRHEGIGVRAKHVADMLVERGITPPSKARAT